MHKNRDAFFVSDSLCACLLPKKHLVLALGLRPTTVDTASSRRENTQRNPTALRPSAKL